MKKLLFVLVLIFAFVFTGCGGETPEVPDEPIVNEYKITFEENGGSKVEDYLLEEGKTLTLPEITKEGYTFKGWYKDNEYLTEVEENISISSDLTLYAKWEELILETEGLIYKLNSDGRTYYVSDYVGDSTIVYIPNYYNDRMVTGIGDFAFSACSSLSSITIPNSVTSIGNSAFSNCTKLTSITIPNSVTSIGDSAFYGCSSLTSITIPNSVKSIGDSAFRGCSSLTSITIPNSVKSIGDSAFFNCTKLTSITISNSVTSIGDRAFCNCAKLTSITIPNSVISIGISAFSGCFALTSITIPNSVTSIGDYAFSYSSKLTIYCEMASKPIGWSSEWNLSIRQVIWNCEFINIIFMNDDVKILEDINFAKGYTTSLPVIAKQNYIFLGWYKDKELTTKWDDENDIVSYFLLQYHFHHPI